VFLFAANVIGDFDICFIYDDIVKSMFWFSTIV